jgi:hypothetical protein
MIVTKRLPLMEQELPTLRNTPVFSGVRVPRSLVLCVCFVDRSLSFCTFSFGQCVVCSSSIYDSDYPFGIFKLFLQRVSPNFTSFFTTVPFPGGCRGVNGTQEISAIDPNDIRFV